MNMNFFAIFDVVIGLLGIYLIFISVKGFKNGEVDPMIITTEELTKCNDIKGLSQYLMPKCGIFGGFCILFGIQGLLNDSQIVTFPKAVNIVFLIAFVIVWGVFSFVIRKAKKTFIVS